MKPPANVMQHAGTTVPQESIRMSLDANVTHIMSVLTDLYSDKELAVIREYSTNALDSHRCAGIDDPIEVELPTDLRPTFTVRDHGIGMSVDDITDNFSKYGWSSKRETNNEVGILGLGCKSGLTYTNQFCLTAVKSGVKTTVIVTKDDDGTGVLRVLDTAVVDEPNGVEIQIPVAQPRRFAEKARNFFRFWETNSVSIDGEIVESVFDGADHFMILDPDVVVTKGQLDQNYIVMGNIPYPLPTRFDDILGYQHRVVARVPIGTVDFTPSREALHMTSRSDDAVKTLKAFVKERVLRHVHGEIEAAPNHWEAMKLAQQWDGVSKWLSPSYGGEKVPKTLPCKGQEWNLGYRERRAKFVKYLAAEKLVSPKALIIVDHPQRSMNGETKDNFLRSYPNAQFVYVVHHINPDLMKWIDPARIVSYEEIKPARLVRQAGGPRVDQTKWLVRRHDTYGLKDESPSTLHDHACYILRSEQNVPAYMGRGEHRAYKREEFRKQIDDFLRKFSPVTTFVVISTSDVEKFLKLNPQARHFYDFVQDLIDGQEGQLTDHELAWGTNTHPLGNVNPGNIDDPDTSRLAARVRDCMSPRVHDISRRLEQINAYSILFNRKPPTSRTTITDIPKKLTEWETNYPLITDRRTLGSVEVEYMNALFQYRTQP